MALGIAVNSLIGLSVSDGSAREIWLNWRNDFDETQWISIYVRVYIGIGFLFERNQRADTRHSSEATIGHFSCKKNQEKLN